VPLIEASWNDDHPSIYGRFDLGYRTGEPPKLFEFNGRHADNAAGSGRGPVEVEGVGLPRRGSVQLDPREADREVASLRDLLREPIHFAHTESVEDLMTVTLPCVTHQRSRRAT